VEYEDMIAPEFRNSVTMNGQQENAEKPQQASDEPVIVVEYEDSIAPEFRKPPTATNTTSTNDVAHDVETLNTGDFLAGFP
jgi:hypothetical protein